MILDVRPILHTPGKCLPFAFSLDLSDLEFSGRYPVRQPIEVRGEVRNSADLLELSLCASTILDTCCDRCGKPLRQPRETRFSCLLAEELQNGENDDIELLDDGCVDVEELARTAFILDMDTKILCADDCKGLCPRCGADLNLGPCSCGKERNPRLAVLARLLENKDDTAQNQHQQVN